MVQKKTDLNPSHILEKHVKSLILHHLALARNRGHLHFWEIYNGPRIISVGKRKVFVKNPSPGITDLVVMPKNSPAIWAELKRPKGGVQSPDQKAFQKSCEEMGHTYVIWSSLEQCIDTLGKFGIDK